MDTGSAGTQVWLAPAPAGDMLELARQPDLWPQVQEQVKVFSFYQRQVSDSTGLLCGPFCGPNTYPDFMEAVPGGMIHWLSQRFQLAVEVVSVKDYSCTDEMIRQVANGANTVIDNIKTAGGQVTYLSLDEPFTSGTSPVNTPVIGGCDLQPDQVAQLQRSFNDVVYAKHPEVQIGLIETYPKFSPAQLISFIGALDRAGVSLAFFHLDVDKNAVDNQHVDFANDVRMIREFFAQRNIPFGVIITGADGSSDAKFAAGAWVMLRLVASSIGVTEHTVFQSWTESVRGDQNSPRIHPSTVPQSDPTKHTGQVWEMLKYLGIVKS